MENQKSRREKILEARESCSRSLSGTPSLYSRERLKKEGTDEPPAIRRGSVIRLFIAALLFLLIFTWDQLNIRSGKIDSSVVEESLADNRLAGQLEQKLSSFLKEQVLPVFQQKDGE